MLLMPTLSPPMSSGVDSKENGGFRGIHWFFPGQHCASAGMTAYFLTDRYGKD